MQVLELDTRRVSLEFSREEAEAVFAELRVSLGHGHDISRHPHGTYEIVGVGQEDLILMDDWDEPCLISQSGAGDTLLRQVAVAALRRQPRRARTGSTDKRHVA